MSLTLAHSQDTIPPDRHTSSGIELSNEVENLVYDAYAAGRLHGHQQTYVMGWRWGLICGLLPGLLAGGAAVALIFHYL